MGTLRVLGAGAALLMVVVIQTPAASATPRALAALRSRLTAAGRAEVSVSQVVTTAADTVRQLRGHLALELPDRVRVEDTASGERLTARGDGGEWLQPALKQMLILRADQAGQVASVWRMLLDASGRIDERSLGQGRYVLHPRFPDAPVDSIWLQVRSDGLPVKVRASAGEEQWALQFGTWKFKKPRGAAAFKLSAPSDFTVLEWP